MDAKLASPAPMATPISTPATRRLVDIDIAKALTIILVVLGHVVQGEIPRGNDWYGAGKYVLYNFHMSVFMAISGVVFFYRYKPPASAREYWKLVGKRAARLLPAWFALALIVTFGKLGAASVAHVDNAPSKLGDLMYILVRPYNSPSKFLWYIYVLFLFYTTVPLLLALVKNRIEWLLAPALVLLFVPGTDWMGEAQYAGHLFYFLLGAWAVSRLDPIGAWADRYRVPLIVLFVLALAGDTWIISQPVRPTAELLSSDLVLSLIATMAIYSIGRLPRLQANRTLLTIAYYVFSIYLFNTIAIGVCKAVILKFTSWDGWHFWIIGPILLVAGVALSIAGQKLLERFLPKVAAYTR